MDIVAKLPTFVEKSKIKVSKMADMERDNHLRINLISNYFVV
jgi:hypothetical protein